MSGRRLDINRPFGNGIDDNRNFVVDEPQDDWLTVNRLDDNGNGTIDDLAEATLTTNNVDDDGDSTIDEADEAEPVWPGLPGTNSPVGIDRNNDGRYNTDDQYARRDFARHLYVLAMLVTRGSAADEVAHARRIAQWAVNMVDFRDTDSIITGFEFDVDPFSDEALSDGFTWDVDGDIGTDESSVGVRRHVVWGCERPELLITETLAFHDRRTEDLDPPDGMTTDASNPDSDFDQRLRPRGSLFVELYNPWNRLEARAGGTALYRPQCVRNTGRAVCHD